ncbi:MAG: potassium channel family protein [Bacteroidota bacterium]
MIPRLFKSKIYFAVLLLLIITITGVIGFKLLEDVSWLDAIYMTVITISTVGYKEVVELSDSTKSFTIVLIVFSVLTTAFVISLITEYIFSEYSYRKLKQRKVKKNIQELNDHIIICGFGRIGKEVYKRLVSYRKKVVIIEKSEDVCDEADDDILLVTGDATKDETLQSAGVDKASHLICALSQDTENLFVVLSAKQFNTNLRVISRASSSSSYDKIKRAGADNVILPENVGGNHLASLIVSPNLTDFFDRLSISNGERENILEIAVNKLISAEENIELGELKIQEDTGCVVVGLKKASKEFVINPQSDETIDSQSRLIIIGDKNQIESFEEKYNLKY